MSHKKETKHYPQTLALCKTHDHDRVIVITDFDKNYENLKSTKVEIKSCFQNAAENGFKRIHNSLVWINYLEKHEQPQGKSVEIIEVFVQK